MHAWSHDDIGMRFFRLPFSLSSLAGAMIMIGGKVSNSYAKQEQEQDIDWLALGTSCHPLQPHLLARFLTKRARDRLS